MTSPGLLEDLASEPHNYSVKSPPVAVCEAVATDCQADETLLALFIGVNRHAWLFTSRRLLMLRRAGLLEKRLAGQKLIDFSGAAHPNLAEILRLTRVRREIPVGGDFLA